jgi:acetyl-CoA carboxylase biotin carboxyl carrier protein
VNLTHEDVQEILRLLDASPFDELRLETERFKLVLRRAGGKPGHWTQEQETIAAHHSSSGTATTVPEVPAPHVPQPTAQQTPGVVEIRPPIMGTFYRAPKPGAAPFVEVTSEVTEDTVVGIVETMKLMNSIYAGARGRVVEICVADAEFVEPDRVLMRVQAEKS